MNTKSYNFTFVLDGLKDINEKILNELFEAGCDDATLSMSNLVMYLEFDRESNSLVNALQSATKDIYKTNLPIRIVSMIITTSVLLMK